MVPVRVLPPLIHLILIPVLLEGYYFFSIGISGEIEAQSGEVICLRFSS